MRFAACCDMPEISRFYGIVIRMFAEAGAQRLVEAWAELHRAELLEDWTLLHSGQPPVKIDPLK